MWAVLPIRKEEQFRRGNVREARSPLNVTMNTHRETERRTAYVLILIFVFLAAGIVTAGSLYYRNYEKQLPRRSGEPALGHCGSEGGRAGAVSQGAVGGCRHPVPERLLFRPGAALPGRTRGTRTRNASFRRGSTNTGALSVRPDLLAGYPGRRANVGSSRAGAGRRHHFPARVRRSCGRVW